MGQIEDIKKRALHQLKQDNCPTGRPKKRPKRQQDCNFDLWTARVGLRRLQESGHSIRTQLDSSLTMLEKLTQSFAMGQGVDAPQFMSHVPQPDRVDEFVSYELPDLEPLDQILPTYQPATFSYQSQQLRTQMSQPLDRNQGTRGDTEGCAGNEFLDIDFNTYKLVGFFADDASLTSLAYT